jgi:hypothetical protein
MLDVAQCLLHMEGDRQGRGRRKPLKARPCTPRARVQCVSSRMGGGMLQVDPLVSQEAPCQVHYTSFDPLTALCVCECVHAVRGAEEAAAYGRA